MKEPKILVEEHYHIEMLREAQEKRFQDRNTQRLREEYRNERALIISKAPLVEVKAFWCDTCKKDFVNIAYKHLDNWSESAWYKSKHKCGKWVMRFITDSFKDPYWFKSRKVRRDQSEHILDLIQPGETGFHLLYGKK